MIFYAASETGVWRSWLDMVKWVGALVLLLTSVGYGTLCIREERKQYHLLCGVVAFVQKIGENVRHFAKPLSEIYGMCGGTVSEEFLRLCQKEGIRCAWEKAPLASDETWGKVMENFCFHIGTSFHEDCVHLCDYTLEQLKKEAGKQKEELEKREKLYRTLPPLAALSLVLLMI